MSDGLAKRTRNPVVATAGRELNVCASVALGDPHAARTPRHRERHLDRPRSEIDTIRRQLGDPVGNDRAREIDRLTGGADEWKLSDDRQRAPEARSTEGRRASSA